MPISSEITRQNVADFNVISPVGVEVMDEARGHYRGETVTVSSAESQVANAAEEIEMAVAGRADRRSLGQRDVRPGRGGSLETVSSLKKYYDQLPDMPQEAQLASLVEQLATFQQLMSGGGSGGQPTKEDVLAALQSFDQDVTHQYAGLEMAREHFEAIKADPSFLVLLDEARSEFQKTDTARDVHAGFAAAEIASRSAASLETDPATVRDVYRSMLRESMNFGQLFDTLSKFDPLKTFSQAIETFTTAAGRDLGSTGPSTDPLFLHGLLTELGKLKKMQTTLEATKQLVVVTERALPPAQRVNADVVDQTSRILNFASRPTAGQADAQRLLGGFEKASPGAQVVFVNGVRGLHGEIPDAVMPSAQARLQQNSAIMSLLDKLVADEEKAYAARGAA
jgi:type III secretion system YopN/LcrE/InvE/MxiC family regulator